MAGKGKQGTGRQAPRGSDGPRTSSERPPCGLTCRTKRPCKRAAGEDTDHEGRGPCSACQATIVANRRTEPKTVREALHQSFLGTFLEGLEQPGADNWSRIQSIDQDLLEIDAQKLYLLANIHPWHDIACERERLRKELGLSKDDYVECPWITERQYLKQLGPIEVRRRRLISLRHKMLRQDPNKFTRSEVLDMLGQLAALAATRGDEGQQAWFRELLEEYLRASARLGFASPGAGHAPV